VVIKKKVEARGKNRRRENGEQKEGMGGSRREELGRRRRQTNVDQRSKEGGDIGDT